MLFLQYAILDEDVLRSDLALVTLIQLLTSKKTNSNVRVHHYSGRVSVLYVLL